MKKETILKTASFIGVSLLALAFPIRLPGMEDEFHLAALAWVGLMPLIGFVRWSVVQGRSSKFLFLWGWAAGSLFFLLTVFWVTHSMVRYGGLPYWTSALLLLLLAAYLGSYFGCFAWGLGILLRKNLLLGLLSAPPLWVALEWLRGHLLTGFSWAALGYSQFQILPVIQIADVAGVYGVSFLILAVNTALGEGFFRLMGGPPATNRGGLWTFHAVSGGALLLLLASMAYGNFRLSDTEPSGKTLSVGVLQGNIPQNIKWDVQFQRETLEIYRRLTEDAASRGAKLIVWPETAAPFFFQNSLYRPEILKLASQNQVFLLFGSPAFRMTEQGPRPLNSAYLLSPEPRVVGRYDKIHLVPFGEYVPLSRLLFFVSRMVESIGDFMPGQAFTLLETPKARIGSVICFEVIFPELTRRFVLEGADLMISLTNDAWFGETGAPYQHFAMVVLRAVENRTPFARAANTGISGFIASSGRILKTGPLFEEASLVEAIPLRSTFTFYTRYGDLFAYLCIGWAGVFLVTAGWRTPRKP